MGAPYIYGTSRLRVKHTKSKESALLGSYAVSTGLFDPDEGYGSPKRR